MNSRITAAQKLTLGAMTTALTLLALYAASMLPTGRVACYFLSSVFVYTLCSERAYLSAFAAFLATAILAFFILPDRTALLPYVFLLGHYGIVKTWLECTLKDQVIIWVLKLFYCNIFTGLGIFSAIRLLNVDILALLPQLADWLLVLLAEVAFVTYDVIFTVAARLYDARIRRAILPRR